MAPGSVLQELLPQDILGLGLLVMPSIASCRIQCRHVPSREAFQFCKLGWLIGSTVGTLLCHCSMSSFSAGHLDLDCLAVHLHGCPLGSLEWTPPSLSMGSAAQSHCCCCQQACEAMALGSVPQGHLDGAPIAREWFVDGLYPTAPARQ